MSLATKYRPKTFEEVCGQNTITTILNKTIEKNKFSNVLLFAGPSGCGKTTLARIFANKINHGFGEPIETDAASIGRGSDKGGIIDAVKAISDAAKQRAIVGEYKVYIIDECHALSSEAWQTFLKCIEECPKYTVFIFCTTEVNKVPATILNRVQQYNISKISASEIKSRLEYICEKEGFTNYSATCDLISKICQGGMRDAIATLEQVSNFSTDLNINNAKQVLVESSFETMFKLTWAIQKQDKKQIMCLIDSLYDSGKDLKQFMSVYLDFILDLEKYLVFADISITAIPNYLATEQNPVVQFTVKEHDADYFRSLSEAILQIKQIIKYDNSYKSTIEILLIKFSCGD